MLGVGFCRALLLQIFLQNYGGGDGVYRRATGTALNTILTWTGHLGIDLGKWPVLKAYVDRVSQRPAVQAALKAEGLAA